MINATTSLGRIISNVGILIFAEIGAMSLWFVSNAIMPELTAGTNLEPWRIGLLSAAVQIGFVVGALGLAAFGIPDRFDPRRVFAIGATLAAISTAALAFAAPAGNTQIALRFATGLCLASVYPVGMQLAVSWTEKRRGLLVGLLVGALTLGSAMPHGLALLGGADWRFTVALASALALGAAGLILMMKLGPYYTRTPAFSVRDLTLAWTLRPVRLAFAGYLAHMWELYAFWAWIATALLVSFQERGIASAPDMARLATFIAISIGGIFCIPTGALADRFGKAKIAGATMGLSASFAFFTALSFHYSPELTVIFAILWGIFIIPDSALFSALVADAAPAGKSGSLMTLQTALGFLITVLTIQMAPILAASFSWPAALAIFGVGPLVGIEAMRRLDRLLLQSNRKSRLATLEEELPI
ncbi:MFS transporter [Sulfitobacter sp. SH24]|uniref:MFS transporter n=1 Tax=Sulfitobacter sp. SH24 TaxID=3421173 RepID=UPI003F503B86